MVSVVSLLLIGLSGLLLDMHRRAWRMAQRDESLSSREMRFARSQYRRRMQASAIIGVLGAAIGMKPLVPAAPWPMAWYVASLAGGCLCLVLLAGLDALATRQNFARRRSEHMAEQITLVREMTRDTASHDG